MAIGACEEAASAIHDAWQGGHVDGSAEGTLAFASESLEHAAHQLKRILPSLDGSTTLSFRPAPRPVTMVALNGSPLASGEFTVTTDLVYPDDRDALAKLAPAIIARLAPNGRLEEVPGRTLAVMLSQAGCPTSRSVANHLKNGSAREPDGRFHTGQKRLRETIATLQKLADDGVKAPPPGPRQGQQPAWDKGRLDALRSGLIALRGQQGNPPWKTLAERIDANPQAVSWLVSGRYHRETRRRFSEETVAHVEKAVSALLKAAELQGLVVDPKARAATPTRREVVASMAARNDSKVVGRMLALERYLKKHEEKYGGASAKNEEVRRSLSLSVEAFNETLDKLVEEGRAHRNGSDYCRAA